MVGWGKKNQKGRALSSLERAASLSIRAPSGKASNHRRPREPRRKVFSVQKKQRGGSFCEESTLQRQGGKIVQRKRHGEKKRNSDGGAWAVIGFTNRPRDRKIHEIEDVGLILEGERSNDVTSRGEEKGGAGGRKKKKRLDSFRSESRCVSGSALITDRRSFFGRGPVRVRQA